MMRPMALLRVAALAAALLVVPAGAAAYGEATHTTITIERRMAADDSPPLADLYQSVLSFEPGSWTALHAHTGGSYNTVLRGSVTLRIGDTDRTFGPGEGWSDEPGVLHVAGNVGDVPAELIATMVVERGIPPARIVETDEDTAPPVPDALAMTKSLSVLPAGPLDVLEQSVTLDPSAEVALPIPQGPRLVGVLDGSLTVTIDGVAHAFEAGGGWSEPMGASYAYVTGEQGVRLAMTTLIPRQASLTAGR
ncbi:MAG: cupin domain-containing protein [Chloroflexi bacterium]|nr:cupin domain-containing protein [Chloroflexota bacterium]